MPRYFFDIKDGHRLVDPSGLICASDADAINRATTLAVAISLDRPMVDPERRVSIRNGAGQEISTVPVYSKPPIEHSKSPAAYAPENQGPHEGTRAEQGGVAVDRQERTGRQLWRPK